MKMLPILAPPL